MACPGDWNEPINQLLDVGPLWSMAYEMGENQPPLVDSIFLLLSTSLRL